MPIKSRIDVGADPEQFKRSLATFQKYQAALKEQHGVYVLQAPYVKAAADAGGQVASFLDLDKAAKSQTGFATAADKAHHAFRGLAGGVVHTLESFARVALSPLQMLFPAGLSVGLLGLGAGLVGAGVAGATLYGLDRAASGVSDRRRRALGLGVDYGAPTAFDLNFARFGAEGGLEVRRRGGLRRHISRLSWACSPRAQRVAASMKARLRSCATFRRFSRDILTGQSGRSQEAMVWIRSSTFRQSSG